MTVLSPDSEIFDGLPEDYVDFSLGFYYWIDPLVVRALTDA